MAKKDAVSKRLAEEIAFAELVKRTPPLFPPEELPAPPAPEELPALLQLGDPWTGPASERPLGFGTDASERPIRDAFKAFGLDHRNLSDWRALVFHLAHVLFPTPRPPGAPREWTDERLCRLLADVATCKRRNPKASDAAICRWLSKKWSTKPETLRRVLQDARNPARNGKLAKTADDLVTQQILRAAAAACGVLTKDAPWTEADEKNVLSKATQAAVEKAIEEADKLWGKTSP